MDRIINQHESITESGIKYWHNAGTERHLGIKVLHWDVICLKALSYYNDRMMLYYA